VFARRTATVIALATLLAGSIGSGAYAGGVLATRGGRLVWLAIPDRPEPPTYNDGNGEYEPDNYTINLDAGRDGELSIAADFTVCDYSLTVGFRLHQEARGAIELAVDVSTYSGCLLRSQHYSAASYADLAEQRLISGDRLADLLALLAEGRPPQDADYLAARLNVQTAADISWETRFLIAALASPSWQDRDAAMSILNTESHLPELRRALQTMELIDRQKTAMELILQPPAAGPKLIEAVQTRAEP
jgi:hypothetical protein